MASFDLPPNRAVEDPVPQRSRPTVEGVLTKAQFSSRFSTKLIVLGLLSLGLLMSTVKGAPPQIGTLQILLKCLIRQYHNKNKNLIIQNQ